MEGRGLLEAGRRGAGRGAGDGREGAGELQSGAHGGPLRGGAGEAHGRVGAHHVGPGHEQPREEGPGHGLRPGVPVVGGLARRVRAQVADGGLQGHRRPGQEQQGHAGDPGEAHQDHGGQQRWEVPLRGEVREEHAAPPHEALCQGALHDDARDEDGSPQQLRVQAAHGPLRDQHLQALRGGAADEDSQVLLWRHQQRDLELHPHHREDPLRRDQRPEEAGGALRDRGPLRQVQGLPTAGAREGLLHPADADDREDRGRAQVREDGTRGAHCRQLHPAPGGRGEPHGLRFQHLRPLRRGPGLLQEEAGDGHQVLLRHRQGRLPGLRDWRGLPEEVHGHDADLERLPGGDRVLQGPERRLRGAGAQQPERGQRLLLERQRGQPGLRGHRLGWLWRAEPRAQDLLGAQLLGL
mmetsp:Transcript_83830/g.271301  ORF Transcript_83830/g.271301 Transcript_83830/m.271301 type:complete len:410 (-) Transcript_83830:693-1922(-)